MIVDAPLLAHMIASGIQAASVHLDEVLEVTVHERAAIVYVATLDKRLYRIRVERLDSLEPRHEEAYGGP